MTIFSHHNNNERELSPCTNHTAHIIIQIPIDVCMIIFTKKIHSVSSGRKKPLRTHKRYILKNHWASFSTKMTHNHVMGGIFAYTNANKPIIDTSSFHRLQWVHFYVCVCVFLFDCCFLFFSLDVLLLWEIMRCIGFRNAFAAYQLHPIVRTVFFYFHFKQEMIEQKYVNWRICRLEIKTKTTFIIRNGAKHERSGKHIYVKTITPFGPTESQTKIPSIQTQIQK